MLVEIDKRIAEEFGLNTGAIWGVLCYKLLEKQTEPMHENAYKGEQIPIGLDYLSEVLGIGRTAQMNALASLENAGLIVRTYVGMPACRCAVITAKGSKFAYRTIEDSIKNGLHEFWLDNCIKDKSPEEQRDCFPKYVTMQDINGRFFQVEK